MTSDVMIYHLISIECAHASKLTKVPFVVKSHKNPIEVVGTNRIGADSF
jgi:hypothetical protein